MLLWFRYHVIMAVGASAPDSRILGRTAAGGRIQGCGTEKMAERTTAGGRRVQIRASVVG